MKRTKSEIRMQGTACRNSLDHRFIGSMSNVIFQKLMEQPFYEKCNTIMCYVSFKNEVNSHGFIKKMLSQNKRVCIPLIIENGILAAKIINDFSELKPGPSGILEPDGKTALEIEPAEIELVIVPGITFDRNLQRIGYGAGYYDRFLSRTGKKCIKTGIAFENQIIKKIPVEKHDIPMDIVITEKYVYKKH